MFESLTVVERSTLSELEGTKEKNLDIIMQEAMTAPEARECIDQINDNLKDTRELLLDLCEREGWKALGYSSWEKCVTSEFKAKERYLYYQLAAAKIEKNLIENDCTKVQQIGAIPETHLRPLTSLPPDEQREVYREAVETAPEGKVTAKHIEEAVREHTGEVKKEIVEEESDAFFHLKRWWRKARKKDKQDFLNWIKESNG